MATSSGPLDRVVELVRAVGNLGELTADQDFYAAGFTSIRSLQLLLELEDAFGVTVPDDGRFPKARTARAVHALLEELGP